MAIHQPTGKGTLASGTALHRGDKYGPHQPKHTARELKARGFEPVSVREISRKVLRQDREELVRRLKAGA